MKDKYVAELGSHTLTHSYSRTRAHSHTRILFTPLGRHTHTLTHARPLHTAWPPPGSPESRACYSHTHTLTHTHSHTHTLTHLHTYTLTHSHTHTLAHSHTHTLAHSLTRAHPLHSASKTRFLRKHSFTRSHVHSFTRSHVHTFTRSRVNSFTRSHVHSFTRSHVPRHVSRSCDTSLDLGKSSEQFGKSLEQFRNIRCHVVENVF